MWLFVLNVGYKFFFVRNGSHLFLALGKTGRIPLILAVWSPVLALSLFTVIGILQINEK